MKKILLFLLMLVMNFTLSAVALENNQNASSLIKVKNPEIESYVLKAPIPKNIKIFKEDGKYGVLNRDNNQVLIPASYDNIKKLGSDTVKVEKDKKWGVLTNNNKLVMAPNYKKVDFIDISEKKYADIIHSIYLGDNGNSWYATTPGRQPEDFFRKTFKFNNNVTWLKFYDYPTHGILPYKLGTKYGLIICNGDYAGIIKPVFDEFYFQDSASAIYQQFNISYSNPDAIVAKKAGKWGIIDRYGNSVVDFKYDNIVMADAVVKEKLKTVGDTMELTFKNMIFPQDDKLLVQEKGIEKVIDKKGNEILSLGKKADAISILALDDENSLAKIYKINNNRSLIKFVNYPSSGIYKYKSRGKSGLLISEKGKEYIIPSEYDDFYFQDSNLAIYKRLGISYSNPDLIIAKKNGKWGVINKQNERVVDFIYDWVIMQNALVDEKISVNKNDVTFSYKSISFPQSDLILVGQKDKYGVINRTGHILIPLKYSFIKPVPKKKIVMSGFFKFSFIDSNETTFNIKDAIKSSPVSKGLAVTLAILLLASIIFKIKNKNNNNLSAQANDGVLTVFAIIGTIIIILANLTIFRNSIIVWSILALLIWFTLKRNSVALVILAAIGGFLLVPLCFLGVGFLALFMLASAMCPG